MELLLPGAGVTDLDSSGGSRGLSGEGSGGLAAAGALGGGGGGGERRKRCYCLLGQAAMLIVKRAAEAGGLGRIEQVS
jgi:hypothetical protein